MIGIVSKEKVSITLINTIKEKLCILKEIFPWYNWKTVQHYASQLLVHTPYDNAIPSTKIKPRKHQMQLIEKVKENCENGFLIIYNSMIGSGKTFTIVALATFLMNMKQLYPDKYKDVQIIFACNMISVKKQVLQLCWNAGIKIGNASSCDVTEKNPYGYKISNHYNTNNVNRIVIVTSPEVAAKILSDV
jgi:superfamily II DNA or RNA helicase